MEQIFPWQAIQSAADLDMIVQESFEHTIVIFKHSTRCNISSIAKHRIESDWTKEQDNIKFFYLDLLKHRDISNLIAEKFQVHHQSPQIIVIKNGEVVLDANHLDIQVAEILEVA